MGVAHFKRYEDLPFVSVRLVKERLRRGHCQRLVYGLDVTPKKGVNQSVEVTER